MKKLVLLSAICASSAILTGCANPYKEPTSGEKSSIQFIDDASYKMSVHFHEGYRECTDRSSAGVMDARSHRTLQVSAGRPMVFTVGMDAGYRGQIGLAVGGAIGADLMASVSKSCTPTLEFTPEAGRSYVFRMKSDGRGCSYEFSASRSSDGTVPAPVDFTAREWIRALGEAGPWCKRKS